MESSEVRVILMDMQTDLIFMIQTQALEPRAHSFTNGLFHDIMKVFIVRSMQEDTKIFVMEVRMVHFFSKDGRRDREGCSWRLDHVDELLVRIPPPARG